MNWRAGPFAPSVPRKNSATVTGVKLGRWQPNPHCPVLHLFDHPTSCRVASTPSKKTRGLQVYT